MSIQKHKLHLLARCRAVVGDGSHADVLAQVIFWLPHADVKHNDRKLLAKTAWEMAAELQKSERTVRRATKWLVDHGMIETILQEYKGKTQLHFDVADHILEAVARAKITGKRSAKVAATDRPEWPRATGQNGRMSIDTKITDIENVKDNPSDLAVAGAFTGEDQGYGEEINTIIAPVALSDSIILNLPVTKGEPVKTIKSVHDVMLAKRKSPKLTANWLSVVWREEVAEQTGGYQGPATNKDLALFKQFITTVPDGQAEDIVRCVVRHWMGFALDACEKAGFTSKLAPTQPRLEFLVKHANVAVDFFRSKTASAKESMQLVSNQNPRAIKPPTLAPVGLAKPAPAHKPATKEEVLKILAGDE